MFQVASGVMVVPHHNLLLSPAIKKITVKNDSPGAGNFVIANQTVNTSYTIAGGIRKEILLLNAEEIFPSQVGQLFINTSSAILVVFW